ncbi:sulfotransferase domain-containing protein (plasmid) [Roseobacteraceae bacterium NS-SX3]
MPPSREPVTTDAGIGRPPRKSRLNKALAQIPVSFRKNYNLAANHEFWQLVPFLLSCRLTGAGAGLQGRRIFVATHHKGMTTYFKAVLKLLAFGLGERYESVYTEPPQPGTGIFLSAHSQTPWDRIGPYRGIHIMRDPRDMIVSSYHYHLWTHEMWVHVPDADGVTYQEKLRAAGRTEALFMTIRHFIFFSRETLENWDLDDPDILEISYDELMGENRAQVYERMFTFLGLEGRAHRLGVRLMHLFEAGKRSRIRKDRPNERAHIRSGRSGQWRQELEPAHIAYIEQELGHILDKFGYPRAAAEAAGATPKDPARAAKGQSGP